MRRVRLTKRYFVFMFADQNTFYYRDVNVARVVEDGCHRHSIRRPEQPTQVSNVFGTFNHYLRHTLMSTRHGHVANSNEKTKRIYGDLIEKKNIDK